MTWDTRYNPFTLGNDFVAASMDVSACNQGQALAAQALIATWVPVIQATPAGILYYNVQAAGVTPGAGVNRIAVFASDGQTELAVSGDLTTDWESTGNKSIAFATPFVIPTPGVYVAALADFTGTAVALLASNGGGAISNLGPFPRSFTALNGQPAIPPSFNPGSVVASLRVIGYGFT